ncbi:malonyl-[acyl-carrier protein] O-methyltransferase [bacterium BMS3Abin10]|nr:malonyl-[acyl-carrier protein] O-methyltransferase [bacterium BMS3Abin10]GBE40083.1 malonyl-[acyl-carrier protein] O-methyltransferase [bacterium BMS3Bbin08]HDH51000.1 methyltransferase domain-containing protein [Nitrospirota bacterium]HDK17428.1 methyltransferase domain-containing protein [Nitrospirota bacterium]
MELRKEKIKKAFSRSANTYDIYADVQKESADKLIDRFKENQPGSVLEIGCATGNYTLMLADRLPAASITSIDFSEQMIEHAASRLAGRENIRFICADAEDFVEKTDKKFDLITSNATFQWFSDLDRSLRNTARLLSDRGILLCSVFGPRTFFELELALSHVCGKPAGFPAHSFPEKNYLLSLLNNIYSSVEFQELDLTRKYASTLQFLRYIKNTGTTGGYTLRPFMLTRSRINTMDAWFGQNYGGCRATYQVFLVKAYK